MKNNISIISITDFSDYEEGKSNTGGKYAYNTTYAKIGVDRWEVSHSTTADFEYCEICGSFGHNRDDCQWQSDNEVITTEKLDAIILSLIEDGDFEIAYKYEQGNFFSEDFVKALSTKHRKEVLRSN